jgi:hypothetical protein
MKNAPQRTGLVGHSRPFVVGIIAGILLLVGLADYPIGFNAPIARRSARLNFFFHEPYLFACFGFSPPC